MRAHILRAAISKHGGLPQLKVGEGISYVLADKSCETDAGKVGKVKEDVAACPGAACVNAKWLELVVREGKWKDPDAEADLLLLDPPEDGHVAKKRRTTEAEPDVTLDKEGAAQALTVTTTGELPAASKYLPNSSRTPQPLGPGFQEVLRNIVKRVKRGDKVPEMVYEDAECIAIYDAFPKAKFHLLVLPKVFIELNDLKKPHLDLLRHLHRVALHLIEGIRAESNSSSASEPFRAGYHSVPSIKQLHLHVISADFDSPRLKDKKHWNSFQPPFLLDSADVMLRVETSGGLSVNRADAEALLKAPLRSHRTKGDFKNMPLLKAHLASCSEPVSTGVVY